MNICSIQTISLVALCAPKVVQSWTWNVNFDWENRRNCSGSMSRPVITASSTFSPRKTTIRNGGKLEINGSTASLTVNSKDVVVDNNYAIGFISSLLISNGGTLIIQSDKKMKDREAASLTGGSILVENRLEVSDDAFSG